MAVNGSLDLPLAGTATITGTVTVTGTVNAVEARTASSVSAALATDKIMNNLTELTPKFAFANVAQSQTDSSIVALVAAKQIRVLSYSIVTGTTFTNVTFNSKGAGAGTAISSLKSCAANGGISSPFSPVGYFQTAAGETLTVTTGAGSTVGIDVCYVEV